jgi:DnaJ domain
VQLVALIFWAREGRLGAYLCSECGRRQTIKSLFLTALLGWWSFPSWFFYGWRAIYLNWRAVFAPPPKPHQWGALSGAEFADILNDTREESAAEAEEEWLLTETPFRDVTPMQVDLVLGAEALYEQLGVQQDASNEELHQAFRRRCKAAHPDLRDGSRVATEEMMRLNQAWEILRSPAMRTAYDWLQSQHGEVVG